MRNLYLFVFLAFSTIGFAQNPAELAGTFSIPGAPANYWYFTNPPVGAFTQTAKAAVQPDGKIIVASGKGLERVDGNIKDLTFVNEFTGFPPRFQKLKLQPDGKLLVKGIFQTCNGVEVKNLVRLMADGSLDPTFTLGPDGVEDFELQPDGKIVFLDNGEIKRLNADGSLDPTLAFSDPDFYVQMMKLAPNGKIWFINNMMAHEMKCLNADGTVNASFAAPPLTNGNGTAMAIAFQPDGKAIVHGLFDAIIPDTPNVVRLNENGSVDATFQPGSEFPGLNSFSKITDVLLLPSGDILLSSEAFFSDFSSHIFNHIVKLSPTGAIDLTYDLQTTIEATNGLRYMTLLPDGNILAQSEALNTFDRQFDYYYKFNAQTEAVDMSFNNGPGFSNKVRAIVTQPDGKILVAGDFSNYSQSHKKYIIRLNEDRTPDESFNGPNFSNPVYGVALQQDGKIIVVGSFSQVDGVNVSLAVRLMPDGSLDTTFVQELPQFPQHAIVVVVQPDDKIVVGGGFNVAKDNKVWKNMARLNADGTLDVTFFSSSTPSYGTNGAVRAIALQADGKILVGGDFTSMASEVNAGPNQKLMRFNPDGTRDNAMTINFDGSITALALEPSGNILVGAKSGSNYLTRLSSTGAEQNFSNPLLVHNKIYAIVVQPDGKILVAGSFTSVENYYQPKRIVRFWPSGNLDQEFDSGTGFEGDVLTMVLQGNGRILAGGAFNSYNGQLSRYMATLTGDDFYVIRGTNRIDYDNDGCEAGDPVYPFLKFEVSNGQTNIPNAAGSYAFSMPQGTYTFTPVFENPTYYTASPASITVDFPSAANPTSQDFCIVPNGIHSDLEVTLLPVTVARPGFDATYRVFYKNKGNQVESGSLVVGFDDAHADVVSSVPAATVSAGSLTWNFTDLYPGESRSVTFILNLNSAQETPPVNGDDVLNCSAAVVSALTDEMPADNQFILHQTVVNAFDPNDKTCLEGASILLEDAGDYVHYIIRFENTGTHEAQNITVRDAIDASRFDIATLVPIAGSHLFTTRIEGQIAEFIFDNINLPFNNATNDGFVAFKIKTLPTLVNGDVFANAAGIYFDYNEAIETAPTATVIGSLGTSDFEFDDYLSLYPNPAKDVLNIHKKADIELGMVSIYNMLGQLLRVLTRSEMSAIEVSGMPPGQYFLKIETNKGTSTKGFLKN